MLLLEGRNWGQCSRNLIPSSFAVVTVSIARKCPPLDMKLSNLLSCFALYCFFHDFKQTGLSHEHEESSWNKAKLSACLFHNEIVALTPHFYSKHVRQFS